MEVLETLVVAKTPQTLLDFAQDLQSMTSFAPFAIAGMGATLFLADAGLIFEHKVETLVVTKAEDQRLIGVFIYFDELQRLAERGVTVYRPRADSKLSDDLENKRAYVLTALLQTIEAEGGHEGVMTVINGLNEAASIRENVKSGSQDLLAMFDQTGAHTFFTEIGGKPMEFRSGHFSVWGWKRQVKVCYEAFGLILRSAPLGTPNGAYKVGDYVRLEQLFSRTSPNTAVGALMADVIGLFASAGTLDEAKAAVVSIGGVIPHDDDEAEAVSVAAVVEPTQVATAGVELETA